MSPRRFLLLLLGLVCAVFLVRSLSIIIREPGKATRQEGGTPGADGRVPRLVFTEMTAGERFTLDILYPSERASEIYLAFSFRSAQEDVSEFFGEGATLGLELRRTPYRDPGFSPARPVGATPTWHRIEGMVPDRFAGKTLFLQAFVRDEGAVGGFALSDPVSIPVRGSLDGTTYHVDPVAGDDGGPGTASAPWRTLDESFERLRYGDELIVHGGVYRETAVLKESGLPGHPIRIRAAEGEEPVLTGCDVVTGWEPLSGEPLSGEPGYGFSWADDPAGVYVDGALLPRAAPGDDPLPEGTFRHRSGQIELRLAGDDDPAEHTVEVVVRNQGLWLKEIEWVVLEGLSVRSTKEQGVWIDSSEDVRLRDVEVDDALTNHGFQILDSRDCWIEDCRASGCGDQVTHHAGFHVGDWSERVWILDCEADHNILLGISLYRVRDGLVFGSVAHDNIEGIIAEEAPSSWIVECEAYANRNGIGTDGNRVDCPGMRVERCLSHDNGGSGFTNYQNPSGTFFYRNVSSNNGSPWGNGFWLYQTVGDTLLHNVATGNTGSGFALEGETREVLLANNVIADNVNAQVTILPPSDTLENPVTSLHNLFYGGKSGYPEVQWGWDYISLQEFKTRSGLDTSSISNDPRLEDDATGWLAPASNSPCIDAGAGFGAPYEGRAPDLGAQEVR